MINRYAYCGVSWMMDEMFENHCWKDLLNEDILKVYRAYQRPVYVGPKPAVLAIDLYNKVYLGGPKPAGPLNDVFPGSCGEFAWNALPHTIRLLDAARAAKIPVIYSTRHADTKGVQSTFRKLSQEAEELYHIKDEVAPRADELVIYKERASVFFGTPLIAHLRLLGVESLIICGEATSGCVRASTVDAYSYGFHCTLVEECVFDTTELCHKVNLFDMHHKYADVMHIDEVLDHICMART
jgi:maleamate amidohydrolase